MVNARYLVNMDWERKIRRERIENFFNVNHARETTIGFIYVKLMTLYD